MKTAVEAKALTDDNINKLQKLNTFNV